MHRGKTCLERHLQIVNTHVTVNLILALSFAHSINSLYADLKHKQRNFRILFSYFS